MGTAFRSWGLALVVTLGAGLCAPVAAAGAEAPIAVMPFKNLNAAPDLRWLEVGVAETMVSDLRRAGQKVVERSQLEGALNEIALQQAVGSETSTAARVGKMVGAKTVVVGGFQRANNQIRITARFVDVQTGEVKDTAKVTGSLKNIFGLQDDIVARLIGKRPPARKRRVVTRKATTPTTAAGAKQSVTERPANLPAADTDEADGDEVLRAYIMFSESLSAKSVAERVAKLREVIKLDPNFFYAVDDLEALEKRLAAQRVIGQKARAALSTKQMQDVKDPSKGWDVREAAAMAALQGAMVGRTYEQLLDDATTVYGIEWPPSDRINLREYASLCIVVAHNSLKHADLALQAGERHLGEFPGGLYSVSVSTTLDGIIRTKRRNQEALEQLPAALEKIEASYAKDLARATRYARGDTEKLAQTQRRLDHVRDIARCRRAWSTKQLALTRTECERYLDQWADAEDHHDDVLHVQWTLAQAFAEAGDFEEAKRRAQALLDDEPEFARRQSLNVVTTYWPQ